MAKNKGVRFYEEYKKKDYRKHPELHKYNQDTKKGGAKHLHDRAMRYLKKKFLLELCIILVSSDYMARYSVSVFLFPMAQST
ncbi:unnamed protein product, partial [marine sediment metagenome]